ncbi:hypothetical protein N6H14_29910 [Paenibacillus sp. CC-CFT747]|nr:hypothetical protein N6H14_29910 [Paenibacillus sp. CC-CFT747]
MTSKGTPALQVTIDEFKLDAGAGATQAEAAITVKNTGGSAQAVPALAAAYQIKGSTLSIGAAMDAEEHPAYLSPGESSTYHFTAELPSGLDSSMVELVVLEKKPGTPSVTAPLLIAPVPADTGGGSAGETPTSSGVQTPVGKLSLTVKSTYRLNTALDDDILMSEVELTNLEKKVITLPSLYAGYLAGDIDLPGKTVRIQSSPYLNPGQKTTLYLYSKLSYQLPFESGKVYLGSGILDAKAGTWSQKREWTKLDVAPQAENIHTAALSKEWMIQDTGRVSTAQVVDSKVYANGNQKIMAVRIQQTNKEARNGASVSYVGYVTDGEGSVWQAQTLEEPGKLCKECSAMSTLWVTVPRNADESKLTFVFGQKLEEEAFAAPQQYPFQVVDDQDSVSDGQLSAAMNPYLLTLQNMQLVYSSKKIDLNFQYQLDKGLNVAGVDKNRSLVFELVDSTGTTVKTWESPLEGAGALANGSSKLSLDTAAVLDIMALLNSAQMNVYEKFEGASRLLGTMKVTR